jgi:hypothetical protein
VLSHFSLDSAEGGQRIEIAKYKKIENSKFLSDRHPFNIPSLLVGTVGLTLRLNFEGSGFQPGRQSQPIGVVGDVHSANLTVKKVKFSPSKRLVTCGAWQQPLIAYQIFTWIIRGGTRKAGTEMVKFDEQSICGFTSSNYFSCSMVK